MRKIISIRSYGVKVGSTGNRFLISSKEGKQTIPALDISEILLYGKAINITTSAIMLAVKNRIPIFLMSNSGRPYSIISPIIASGTVLTKRAQYSARNERRGFELAKAFIYGKMRNQERLLRIKASTEREKAAEVRRYADNISELAERLLMLEYDEHSKSKIMMLEATAAKDNYWKGFTLLLPDGFTFIKREHRNAKDPVNMLLNYGYGFLLTRVINAVIISGLDIHAGFLHEDRAGRESLALDLIEEFRQPVVDATVLKILRLKELKMDEVVDADNGTRLSRSALQKIIAALKERLEQKVNMLSIDDWIVEQARNIARFLRGEVQEYRPFIM